MNYKAERHSSYRVDKEGNVELMANFTARITKEIRTVDGIKQSTTLTIIGKQFDPDNKEPNDPNDPEAGGTELPPITIDAEEFTAMSWVLPRWGVQAVIRPGASIKDDLRTFIQLRSTPDIETVYRAIGWQKVNDQTVYIHAGGAVTAKGNDEKVSVALPRELSRYNLLGSIKKTDIAEAIAQQTQLLAVTMPEITWPLLAATLAPLLGPVDFAVHLTGRTGTFKTEVMSLFQSCYGKEMDARHMPASWSSTANALEAQAYYAANAPLVIDDFVPSGTTWQVRGYQTKADAIIRAQGNQAGRARLTDTSNLQTTMYPRGIILSTGEDTPEGQSVRARMLILELSPGDVNTQHLTNSQKKRAMLPTGTAAFIRWIIANKPEITPRVEEERSKHLEIGHSRTPGMLARLIVTAEVWTEYLEERGSLSKQTGAAMRKAARTHILFAGNKQQGYLESTDPTDVFTQAIRHALGAGLAHIRSLNGGVPKKPQMLGWIEENSQGEMPTYKAKGPCMGWIEWNKDEIYIDITTGYPIIKKVAGAEITLTKQTMIKRLKDAGLIVRADEGRQRNTIRIKADNNARTVIVLPASTTLETQEVPE